MDDNSLSTGNDNGAFKEVDLNTASNVAAENGQIAPGEAVAKEVDYSKVQLANVKEQKSDVHLVPDGETAEETFGRLEREVEEQTVCSEKLVSTILYLLVGNRFDMENAYIFREGAPIRNMVTLLDDCSPVIQAEVWSVFIGIVRKSNRNMHACLLNDLVKLILDRLSVADGIVADLFIELLTVLTTYSIDVKDLNAFIRYLRASEKHWPCHSAKLLHVVKQTMRKEGPNTFFNFAGTADNGIHIPPISKWPYQTGWSFVTWLRLDPQNNGNFDEDVPYLYSFRTKNGLGHCCYFVGGCMVVVVHKSKAAQPLQQCIKHTFQIRKWYHVALTYSFSRWGRREIFCYVNGQLISSLDINWHVSANEVYDKCFVGCSPGANSRNGFSGQFSTVYLFGDTLSPLQVDSLYGAGQNYQSCFKFKNEIDLQSLPHKASLFDGRLFNSLIFAYSPKNCDRQLCLNSAVKEDQTYFRQSTHAVMMEGVTVVATHSILTSLHSVGGVQVLLPFMFQLDVPVLQVDNSTKVDYSISHLLLSIFSQLLASSPDVPLQMLQSNAFLVIGASLTSADTAHVSEDVLATLIDMCRFLFLPHRVNAILLRQIFDFVMFNPDIWINTDGNLQTRLYAFLSTEFFDAVRMCYSVRRTSVVVHILHTLKFYYWITDPRSRSGINPKGKDGPRPTADQILAIRAYLLTFLFKIMVKEEPGGEAAEQLNATLNFLSTMHEDDNVIDVLQTLIRLMSENPAAIVPTFDKNRGVCVVFKLVGAESESIRLLALKLLGFFLRRCTAKRKEESMGQHNLYTLLVDRLLLHASYLNMRTYNVLFEILTEDLTPNVFNGRHKDSSVSCAFENPLLIKTIATLLHQSEENAETFEVKKVFLTDLIGICNNSKENRRCILQMSVWQDWLVSLGSLYPETFEAENVLKLIYNLFSILLHHAVKVEYGGWRVWIDTMAIIHSKASYEQFRRQGVKPCAVETPVVLETKTSEDLQQVVYDVVQELLWKVESSLGLQSNGIFNINQNDSAFLCPQRLPSESSLPLYRIPEFRWSQAHLILLSDLLLSIETDIAAWKNVGSRTLIDAINMSENAIFVVNSVHVISQSLDNFIVACGGLLPLLAALTSPNTELEVADTTGQGLPVHIAISFLIRLANLTDVIAFGTACNFSELEHEKNMPSGGIMRQVLRLVTTVAVRNCLVARYKTNLEQELVVSVKDRTLKALLDDLASVEDLGNDFLNLRASIQDPDRLLQEVDVYRLKAAVYRDIEESRHSQFLALATIYFVSVLMVSRYRDILEPPSSPSPFHNTCSAGSNWDQVDNHGDNSVANEADKSNSAPAGECKDVSKDQDGLDDLTDSITENISTTSLSEAERNCCQSDSRDSKDSINRERQAMLTARLRTALEPVAPLFREIINDFQSYFQKTLLGTHGQEIMNDPKVLHTLKSSSVSVVELVMLLCSQEWQTSLQKHAGLAFIELVNEGRLLAHATRDHLVRVANEAEHILNRIRAEDVLKHAEFEKLCAQAVVVCKEEENTCNTLMLASRRRNVIVSNRILQKVVNILESDCGAWGGLEKNRQFWMLDLWEDDSRRRKRLVPNPHGTAHPEASLKSIDRENARSENVESEKERNALASFFRGKSIAFPASTPSSTGEELIGESEMNVFAEDKEVEAGQQGGSYFITLCRLIAPGLSVPGILSISNEEFAFDAKEDDPEFKNTDYQTLRCCEHLHGRWPTREIRAIFLRRFLLQNKALEIFMSSRTAIMFAFSDQTTVKKVVRHLPSVGVGVKYGIPQSRKASLMTPRQLFKQSNMSQKWQRREISNFDYLMFLNTIAGRTYNDLNQYPVFPWILSNYEVEELDLKQPANFRDLSKPIGALTDSRRQFFIERYNQWEHEKIPPFHYGTHYSTAAFALNWLIRLEPFTTLFLSMQGGKFDHADRLFHSISESWNRCLRDTHDVKELIPEFFYLPEIFVNINGYDMGKRDDGTMLGNVKLPLWAESPEHFVTIHRRALESDLVSCQLHQWIDLIFGYKQRGPEAVRATNVFYYLTYEGVVDFSVLDDPTTKQAIENQIHHFGQTPAQLLFEPHTPRQSIMAISPLIFKSVPKELCMIMKFISNSPVVHLSANTHLQLPNPTIVSVTANLCFALNRWNNNFTAAVDSHINPAGSDLNAPTNRPLTVDPLLATGNPAAPIARRALGDLLDQNLTIKWNNFVTSVDSKFIFVCGYPDNSFRIIETDNARIRQIVFGHKAVVTCLARSECNLLTDSYIASGSRDCTVLLWHWNVKHGLLLGEQSQTPSGYSIPKAVLIGHDSEINCVVVNAEHGLVLSSSIGSNLLIHTTQGDLLRCLHPSIQSFKVPRMLLVSRECLAVVCYDRSSLCLFTTSGRLLKHVTVDTTITCMCLSRDGEYFITGSEEGVVSVYCVFGLTCLLQYPSSDSAIRSVALVHNHRFVLSGLASGAIVVYNIDFNRWHHEYSQRYSGNALGER